MQLTGSLDVVIQNSMSVHVNIITNQGLRYFTKEVNFVFGLIVFAQWRQGVYA